MKYFSSGEGLTAFPLWLKLPRRFTKQRPGRLFFVLVEGAQRDRAEQPGKQVVARCLSTIHQTRMVGRADHGRDFILSVYDVLGAAQFSRDSKAGRAIDAGGMAHDWLSIVSTARAELQYLRVPGVIQRDLNRQQDGLIGFANRLFHQLLVRIAEPLQGGHQLAVALHDTAKPLLELSFAGRLGHNERQNLAGCFV
jgi:hypothetical protein